MADAWRNRRVFVGVLPAANVAPLTARALRSTGLRHVYSVGIKSYANPFRYTFEHTINVEEAASARWLAARYDVFVFVRLPSKVLV